MNGYTEPRQADFDEVWPGICVGSHPPRGDWAQRAGFQLLVLTAFQRQPPAEQYQGVLVVHAPLTDDAFEIVEGDWERAMLAAQEVASVSCSGQRVLVSCVEGRNRSGLVAALAVHILTGMSGQDACSKVQAGRSGSLYNWHFVQALRDRCPASAAPPELH